MKQPKILLLILALTFPLVVSAQQTGSAQTPPARVQARPQTNRVERVQFRSQMIGAELPYHVVLPLDYHARTLVATRYPVLYLLHGFGGRPEHWIDLGVRENELARRMIVVLVEGRNAWYTDSASVPTDKFESYIVRELIPDVDRRFRTTPAREGRSIAGLSMGGFGAIKFGLKYPNMFAFAGSMSGAIGVSSWRNENDLPNIGRLRRLIIATFGAADHPTHIANDLYRIARETPVENLPFLYLDCGTEDFLFETNRAFIDILLERRIPHEYRQLPGGHTGAYWRAQLPEVIEIAARTMSAPQRATGARKTSTNFSPPLTAH